jgi:hypothetical protein
MQCPVDGTTEEVAALFDVDTCPHGSLEIGAAPRASAVDFSIRKVPHDSPIFGRLLISNFPTNLLLE